MLGTIFDNFQNSKALLPLIQLLFVGGLVIRYDERSVPSDLTSTSCSSKGILETTPKAGIPRWFTGCYKNEEDTCFGLDGEALASQLPNTSDDNSGRMMIKSAKKLKVKL